MYLEKEDKLLIGVLAAAVLFFISAMHTTVYEAERKLEQDFGIEAELDFEADINKPNIYEQLEQQRAELINTAYSNAE